MSADILEMFNLDAINDAYNEARRSHLHRKVVEWERLLMFVIELGSEEAEAIFGSSTQRDERLEEINRYLLNKKRELKLFDEHREHHV